MGDSFMKQAVKTKISSEEFKKAYEQKIIPDNLYSKYWNKSVFMGRLKNDEFYFYWDPAHATNSFKTILKGTIKENHEGCIIEYRFDKNKYTKIFAGISSSSLFIAALILLINQELLCLIPFSLGLLCIIPAILKTKRSKRILLKQLLKLSETSSS